MIWHGTIVQLLLFLPLLVWQRFKCVDDYVPCLCIVDRVNNNIIIYNIILYYISPQLCQVKAQNLHAASSHVHPEGQALRDDQLELHSGLWLFASSAFSHLQRSQPCLCASKAFFILDDPPTNLCTEIPLVLDHLHLTAHQWISCLLGHFSSGYVFVWVFKGGVWG